MLGLNDLPIRINCHSYNQTFYRLQYSETLQLLHKSRITAYLLIETGQVYFITNAASFVYQLAPGYREIFDNRDDWMIAQPNSRNMQNVG